MADDVATIEAPAAAPAEGAVVVDAAAAVEAPAEGGSLLAGDGAAAVETPEQIAEREAAEAAAETPEKKAEREAAEAKAAGAPEEYAEFTMPDGVTLDTEAADSFKAKAKELNLSQENAQKLVDEVSAMRQREAATAKAFIDERGGVIVDPGHAKQWREAAEADPEIGGDKLPESLATARRGLEAYGTPALFKLLDKSGLADNPEMLRFLVKAGRTAAEDKVIPAGRPASPTGGLASRLFPPTSAKE